MPPRTTATTTDTSCPHRRPGQPHREGSFLRLVRRVAWYNLRYVARLIVAALGGLRAVGTERVPLRGGLIVAANHLSLADPPLLQLALPRFLHFLMTDRFYYLPLLHGFSRFWGVLVVKEGGMNKESLRAATDLLEQGEAIGVFPEGGLRREGRPRPVQQGMALLAQRARVPILPVAIAGTERLLPPDTWRIHRSRVVLYVGELIPPDDLSRDELARRVAAALRGCEQKARSLWPRRSDPDCG